MINRQEIQQLIFAVLFEYKSALSKALKDNRFDLAPMHFRALAYFARHPEATQQQLVEKSGRDKAQITRLIKELENKDFLRRKRDDTDRRSFRISLTAEGRTAYKELKKLEDKITDRLMAGFNSEEIEGLKNHLQNMLQNLRTS
ncbi:MarR family transcriptional regulator [Verrucomicrobia bacterium S94]|nr:MarR family transcriptional regulator [Verrucomicrobia bacterium S94]